MKRYTLLWFVLLVILGYANGAVLKRRWESRGTVSVVDCRPGNCVY